MNNKNNYDEVVEKESNLPYILSPILIILFVTLLIFIIPKIKIDKDKNIFENISNKINKKDNSSANSTEKIKIWYIMYKWRFIK